MSYTIGVDLGGTTTKLVAVAGQEVAARRQTLTGPEEGFAGQAVEEFLDWAGIPRGGVERVVLTGVRTSFLTRPILGLPTHTVPEFEAIGRGGLWVSGLERALVVSMGTGTALVLADGAGCTHLGGSGIGGGTLQGLGRLLLGEGDVAAISRLAAGGRPEQVDLLVGDICRSDLPSLQRELTAANFGKLSPGATREDLALGLVTLVLQSVGVCASFALQGRRERDVALTGTLAGIGQGVEQFQFMSQCFGLRFHIPQEVVFATALGAVLCPTHLRTSIPAPG